MSNEDEVVSLRPFWGVAEIVGAVAAIAPFVLTASSLSTQTVNGEVTRYVFRDWIAVGGGGAAILCALGVAARWRGTQPSKRALRGAIAALLLALGAYQVLRGFGVIGQPAHEVVAEVKPVVVAPVAPAPDLAPLALDFLAKWQAGELHELYAAASRNSTTTSPRTSSSRSSRA